MYGIAKPKDTPAFEPALLFVPCVGYGPRGCAWATAGASTTARWPRWRRAAWGWPTATASCPGCSPQPRDVPLDAILNEDGVAWPAP
jgi:hypothetical protein